MGGKFQNIKRRRIVKLNEIGDILQIWVDGVQLENNIFYDSLEEEHYGFNHINLGETTFHM